MQKKICYEIARNYVVICNTACLRLGNYKHVPNRESKHSQLDSLGFNPHTIIIAFASPAYSNTKESSICLTSQTFIFAQPGSGFA